MSNYGLDDRAIGVRSPAEVKDFSSSLYVQIGSGAHPSSCPMGTGGPSPGVKRGRGVMLTTHPIYCRGREWVGAIPPLLPSASIACSGTALLTILTTSDKQRMGKSCSQFVLSAWEELELENSSNKNDSHGEIKRKTCTQSLSSEHLLLPHVLTDVSRTYSRCWMQWPTRRCNMPEGSHVHLPSHYWGG
jgi:hypothetical protein